MSEEYSNHQSNLQTDNVSNISDHFETGPQTFEDVEEIYGSSASEMVDDNTLISDPFKHGNLDPNKFAKSYAKAGFYLVEKARSLIPESTYQKAQTKFNLHAVEQYHRIIGDNLEQIKEKSNNNVTRAQEALDKVRTKRNDSYAQLQGLEGSTKKIISTYNKVKIELEAQHEDYKINPTQELSKSMYDLENKKQVLQKSIRERVQKRKSLKSMTAFLDQQHVLANNNYQSSLQKQGCIVEYVQTYSGLKEIKDIQSQVMGTGLDDLTSFSFEELDIAIRTMNGSIESQYQNLEDTLNSTNSKKPPELIFSSPKDVTSIDLDMDAIIAQFEEETS